MSKLTPPGPAGAERLTVKSNDVVPPVPSWAMTSSMERSTPPQVAVCEPRPSNVSVAKPFHSAAGSKASLATASPAQTAGIRRRVLSAVLVRPAPHSVPGSKPTWPSESMIVVPFRRTTASSPLKNIWTL